MATAYDGNFAGKRPNTIRELLKAGKPTLATRINSTWPLITEIVGKTGKFNYVEFLAEYAPINQDDMANIVRAAELHGMGSMIKVDFANRTHVAQKAVANGFQAILFADHRDAKTVEASIKDLLADGPKHQGRFGYTPARLIGFSQGFTQDDFVVMLEDIVKVFMIEKREAVENIEEICSVDGVDMIQFGPADFSMSCGKNAKDNGDEIREAEEKCIKAAIKHGVRPRAEIMTPEQAQRYIDLGVKDFNIGGEVWNLSGIWSQHGNAMRDIIGE